MIDLTKHLAKFDDINVEQELKEKANTEAFYEMLEADLVKQVQQDIITLKIASGDL